MMNKASKDKLARKIFKEAEWLAEDLFDDRSWRHRTSEIRERPDPEMSRNMSGYERNQLEKRGIHIDNSDIKDLIEDTLYVAKDVERFLDPEYPLQQEKIKLDAELRFSPKVQ